MKDMSLIDISSFSEITGAVAGNIEGCYPQIIYDKNSKTKWVNMVTVLDNPLANGWDNYNDISKDFKANKFDRKEKNLVKYGYNVEMVDAVWLSIITYFIDDLKSKNGRMCIQIHRNSQGVVQASYIIQQLKKYYNAENKNFEMIKLPLSIKLENICIEFKNGFWPNDIKPSDDIDYHISIGLVIGLDKNIPTGKLLIPNQFSKMNTKCNPCEYSELESDVVDVRNILVEKIKIISKQKERFTKCAKIANYNDTNFPNIKVVKLVNINSIWNPTINTKIIVDR